MMQSIFWKFTESDEILFDLFVGTGATAKACLLRTGTKILLSATSIQQFKLSLCEIFATQVLDPESDNGKNERVGRLRETYKST